MLKSLVIGATWLSLFCVTPRVLAEEQIRIATYNIKFLKHNIPANRADQIRAVIASLDADIIGLQEINDRAALERVFDPSEWLLVIDDDSPDSQDVAAAIRRPLKVISPADLDADDADFLFPQSSSNSNWPNRRDGLLVQIETQETTSRISLIVVHAKARAGGRMNTDSRREGAARDLVEILEPQVDDALIAVVGDMNDNPDDRSANILESGDPNFLPGPEEIEGPFMFNVAESLLAEEHASWGLSSESIVDGVLETRVPGSRLINNATRDTSADSISPILFDHIVVSPLLRERYVPGSIHVFDDPIAFEAGEASDHVPIYADFSFDEAEDSDGPPPSAPPAGQAIQVVALLPDPEGVDAGNEWVRLSNAGNSPTDLSGWRLRDRAGNTKELEGSIGANGELQIELGNGELPLNNTGDDIELVDADGTIVHRFSFPASQVQPGRVVSITDPFAAAAEEATAIRAHALIAPAPRAVGEADLADIRARAALASEAVYQGIPANEFEEFPVKVLDKGHFVVGYSEDFFNPAWVCYRIGPAVEFRSFPRPGFRTDADTVARVRTQDYTGSGFSRGHMAPNFAMGSRFGAEGAKSTFVMSNVAPQFQSFNDGQWGDLEEWIAGRKPPRATAENFIRGWADEFGEVWIAVGPLFDEERDPLAAGIPVPNGFFCIVVDEMDDGRPRVLAFILPHVDERVDELRGFLKPVDEIEARAGLNFFHLLDDAIEDGLEQSVATELWPLPIPPN